MSSTMIKVENGKNDKTIIDLSLFTHVYKRYTCFSKDYYIEPIPENIFGNNIRLKINTNFGDFINNIILKIKLPEVHLKLPEDNNLDDLTIIKDEAYNNLTIFNNYSSNIFTCFRLIKNKLLETNLTKDNLYTYINNIDVNNNLNYEVVKNNVNDSSITDTIDILQIIKNYINKLEITQITPDIKNNIENNLINIIYNTKIIHKLYYHDKYYKILKDEEIKQQNAYNFAWIQNLGINIIDDISIIINNSKIETLYSDWINIWNELSLHNNYKNTTNILIGNVDELTTYNNYLKPAYNIYLQLKFWFNRKSNLFLPLLYLNHENIILDIKFKSLKNVYILIVLIMIV